MRCRNCREGICVRFTGHGRMVSFCHCARGVVRANPKPEAQLRAELLAAFNETRPS
jgi:hypothetical protein